MGKKIITKSSVMEHYVCVDKFYDENGSTSNRFCEVKVESRDLDKVNLPAGTVKYQFYDRVNIVVVIDGEERSVRSKGFNHSPQYVIGEYVEHSPSKLARFFGAKQEKRFETRTHKNYLMGTADVAVDKEHNIIINQD